MSTTWNDEKVIEGEVVEPTVAALAVADGRDALIRPAASIADIEGAFRDYQALKGKLLTRDDMQSAGEGKTFVKRSGWRKLAVAFGVSFEQRTERIVRSDPDDPNSHPVYAEFVVRAIAPNGRFVDGWGACSLDEPRFRKDSARKKLHHDLPATAETRAKNRAAADLFGMGEVSAEEMTETDPQPKPKTTPRKDSETGAPTPPQPVSESAPSCKDGKHDWPTSANDRGHYICLGCGLATKEPK